MKKKKIIYISFYDVPENYNENRQSNLAAKNKIDYICNVLVKNNYKIEIVSPSWTNNTSGFYKGSKKKISEDITLKTFATFGGKTKIQRVIKYLFSLIQLFFYLLVKSKKNEPIILYHSVILYLPVRLAKTIKKFNLILEVEEIYQDIQDSSIFLRKSEYNAFKNADKYLLSTQLLNNIVNSENKPYKIIYGTYNVEEYRKVRFNDDKVHVVYAGTFDPRKGGAIAAAAAEYLPNNYHVHIIGFGSKEEVENIQKTVEDINKKTEATVTYDGLLRGEEYINFLQKCHIGLSTQIPDAEYNETSFPSKILSYMANGLRVVSVRIKAIEISAVGNAVYYYEEQNPKTIAKAIMSINLNEPYDSRKIIKELDEEFTKEINELLRC